MTAGIGTWAGAFGIGAAISAFYFVLLWLAVRSLTYRAWSLPVHMVVFYFQTLVRIGVVCAGLLLAIVLESPIVEIASAVVGFLAARYVITALVRRPSREGV